MANPRPPIAVFSMTGVEPHIYGKRLSFRLLLDEFNPLINDHFSFMPQGTVRLSFVKRITADR